MDIGLRYPREVAARDGTIFELKLMGPADREAVSDFARRLPEDDLLFLPANINDTQVIDEWLGNIENDRTITVLALGEGRLIGEGSLHHHATNWTRHIGEIRLLIEPSGRGKGLGRILVDEIHTIAKQLGLRMLTAQMTLDQAAAQAVFRRMGFQREAVLWDYVIDPAGQTRNLLVATKSLE